MRCDVSSGGMPFFESPLARSDACFASVYVVEQSSRGDFPVLIQPDLPAPLRKSEEEPDRGESTDWPLRLELFTSDHEGAWLMRWRVMIQGYCRAMSINIKPGFGYFFISRHGHCFSCTRTRGRGRVARQTEEQIMMEWHIASCWPNVTAINESG